MTEHTDKVRGLFLAALMVLSVVVGSIAFAGSAAATASGVTLDDTNNFGKEAVVNSGTDLSGTVTIADDTGDETVTVIIDEDGDGIYDSGDNSTTASHTGSGTTVSFSGLKTDNLAEGDYTVYAVEGTPSTSTDVSSGASATLEIDDTPPGIKSAETKAGSSTVMVTLNDSVPTSSIDASDFKLVDNNGQNASSISGIRSKSTGTSTATVVLNVNNEISSSDISKDAIQAVATSGNYFNDGANDNNQHSVGLTSVAGPSVEGAVEYNDESLDSADTASEIEVSFSEAMDTSTFTGSNINVWVDDSMVADSSLTFSTSQTDSDTLVINGLSSNIDPTQSVTVEFLAGGVENSNGIALYSSDTNESVTVTSRTIQMGGSGSYSGPDSFAYAGEVVAVNFKADNDGLEIKTQSEFVFSGSTGTGSQVFVFDTANRNTSAVYQFDDTADTASETPLASYYLGLRNLGLSASSDDKELKTNDALTVDVSANAGNRKVEGTLYYAGNDSVAATDSVMLSGSGSGTLDFGTQAAADYYVEATDVQTGVTETVKNFTVTGYADADASFPQTLYTDERGDVMNVTVNVEEGGTDTTAKVFVGSRDVNYFVSMKVVDGNDDGEVVLSFDTYDANLGASGTFSAPYADDDKVTSVTYVDGLGDSLKDPLAATGYDLNVSVKGDNGNWVETDVASINLQPRATSGIETYVAPDDATLDDRASIMENAVATGSAAIKDEVLFKVEASGFEGFMAPSDYTADNLNATGNAVPNASTTGVYLEVTQVGTGVNQQPTSINVSQATLIKDLDNNTFYVHFETENGEWKADNSYEATLVVNESSPYVEDTSSATEKVEFSTTVEIDERDVTFDNLNATDALNLPAADNVTVSGTATMAPGTNISVTVKSSGNFLLKNTQVTVQEGGTWSTTFDLAEYAVGADITVTAKDESVTGTLMEAQPTTTSPTPTTTEPTPTTTEPTPTTTEPTPTTTEPTPTTTEPTPTATPTPTTTTQTPGFTMGLGLVALLGAALLALRRD
ncbi:MAG: beta strand repeat-containing protein [Halodesulfurarchaeum sp.]